MVTGQSIYGREKTIGTVFPLTALRSNRYQKEKHGTLADAVLFIDWLKDTKQTAIQFLPLHQTQLKPGHANQFTISPYKGYGIGLDPKYLPQAQHPTPTKSELAAFVNKQAQWLPDYALFCALRDEFKTDDWISWESTIRLRNPKALKHWQERLAKEIHAHIVTQWQLHTLYASLRKKAHDYTIMVIGDTPYYLSLKSPLVWQYQQAFMINADGTLPKFSGIPNGPKAIYGRQAWGHPLYNWRAESDTILHLWKLRIHYMALLFDMVRLDHANGFFLYGELDPTDEEKDLSRKGPGLPVFEKVVQFARDANLKIFAEDQGVEVKDLRKAMKQLQIPGMRVMRYTIHPDTASHNSYDPYPEDTVAYTTTHDTETLITLTQELTKQEKQTVCETFKLPFEEQPKELALLLRKTLLESPSRTVMLPIQDWLLTTERINIPGTEIEENDPNWHYRMPVPIEDLPKDLL